MEKILFIIPGWGGDKTSWNKFTQIAEQQIETVCLELPCFGNEPCPDTIWGVEEYANFVKIKIEEIGQNKEVILLGHSFGGQVAVYLAGKYPNLANKLVLSGAAVYRPENKLRRTIFGFMAKIGKTVFSLSFFNGFGDPIKKVFYRLIDSPDYLETNGNKRLIFQKVIREDVSKFLFEIKIPTLLVWGKNDSYVPIKFGKKIAEEIKNSQLEIIPNGRHGLHIQYPEKLFSLVKKFVDQKK